MKCVLVYSTWFFLLHANLVSFGQVAPPPKLLQPKTNGLIISDTIQNDRLWLKEGIYLTHQDYKEKKLSMIGSCVSVREKTVVFNIEGRKVRYNPRDIWGYQICCPKATFVEGAYTGVEGKFWRVDEDGPIWVFTQVVLDKLYRPVTIYRASKSLKTGRSTSRKLTAKLIAKMMEDKPNLHREYVNLSRKDQYDRMDYYIEKYNNSF